MIEQILITGCTSGLGRALALRFAQENCVVYAVGRKAEPLQALAQLSQNIRPILADITIETDRSLIYNNIDKTKLLSIIHNAAIATPCTLEKITESLQLEHDKTNYIAPTLITQELLPYLHGQRVLFITSKAAQMSVPGLLPYCASKAAMERMALGLRDALQPQNIYCNILGPGMMDTPMVENLCNTSVDVLPSRDFYIQTKESHKLIATETVAEFIFWVMNHTSDHEFYEKPWSIHDSFH